MQKCDINWAVVVCRNETKFKDIRVEFVLNNVKYLSSIVNTLLAYHLNTHLALFITFVS